MKTRKLKRNESFFGLHFDFHAGDKNKNIGANIDIDTFLPPSVQLDEEDDRAQKTEIAFVNPVTMYRNYDLKSDIDVKLKVRNSQKGVVSNGYANVDSLTLKISQLKLPESLRKCFLQAGIV